MSKKRQSIERACSDEELRAHVRVFGHQIHRGWIMVIACGLFQMATVACVFSPIGLFYVAICNETGFERSAISMWQQVHFLAAIIFMPLSVKILERAHPRLVLACCIAGCSLAAALMSVYTEPWQWCISGFLYGSVGALGTMQLAGPIVINNWFHERVGSAMGLYGVIGAIAAVIAAPLFSICISSIGWRASYLVQATAIALLGGTAVLLVRYRPSDIGAAPFGEVRKNETESTVSSLPSSRAFRKAFGVSFVMLFIYAGISSLIGSGFDAHLSGHAVAKGFDEFFSALCISALSLGSGADKLVMGWLNDKIGVNKTVFLEYALVIAGMLGLVFAKSPALFLVAAFIFGIQDSFISVSLPLLVRKHFGPQLMPHVMGWVSIGSGIFGSFGSRLVGLSYDMTGSFDPAFLIGCVLCAVGVVCLVVAEINRRHRVARGLACEAW